MTSYLYNVQPLTFQEVQSYCSKGDAIINGKYIGINAATVLLARYQGIILHLQQPILNIAIKYFEHTHTTSFTYITLVMHHICIRTNIGAHSNATQDISSHTHYPCTA